MKSKSLLLLAFSWLLPQLLQGQGNLIINGTFDTSADGWVMTNVSPPGYNPLKGNPGGCVGLNSSSPSLVPMISQTVSGLVPGGSYWVSGDYSASGGTLGSTPSFGVAIDGVLLFEAAPASYDWFSFNVFYQATSSSALLSLAAGINGTFVAYRVDNITMSAIPEPSSFVLLSCGGVLLFTHALRRCVIPPETILVV